MSDLMCISPIRWTEMQRQPQYLPSRLSRQRRILFVERPVCDVSAVKPQLQVEKVEAAGLPAVTVVRLVVPEACWRDIAHDDPEFQPVYSRLLAEYIQAEHFRDVILWLYDAAATGYVAAIPHKLLVYDAIHQNHPAAHNRPNNQNALLQQANIIISRRRQAATPAI